MNGAGGRLWRSVARPGYARREAAIRLQRLLLGRDPETGLMRPNSPPLDVEWQVSQDTAEALLTRVTATWIGLGQKRQCAVLEVRADSSAGPRWISYVFAFEKFQSLPLI